MEQVLTSQKANNILRLVKKKLSNKLDVTSYSNYTLLIKDMSEEVEKIGKFYGIKTYPKRDKHSAMDIFFHFINGMIIYIHLMFEEDQNEDSNFHGGYCFYLIVNIAIICDSLGEIKKDLLI